MHIVPNEFGRIEAIVSLQEIKVHYVVDDKGTTTAVIFSFTIALAA